VRRVEVAEASGREGGSARYDAASMVTLADVQAAAERIRPYIVRTPLERSAGLSELAGVDVWLKFECFQSTGSFKLRGALNALMLMADAARQAGVVTASAGNHGLGVARAAELLGVPALVIVPETASPAKIDALRRLPAELMQVGATYDDAEVAGRRIAAERGLAFVSPYNDAAVVAGGGTIALEILADLPAARTLLIPAGGGGLIGGTGVAAHGLDRSVVVVGAQSVASPALHAALAAGALVAVEILPSLADGLAGNVEADSITLGLLQAHVHSVLLVEEAEIAAAMRWLLEHEHVLVEGSAAVGVAALRRGPSAMAGPIVVVLSGRNVSAAVLRQYVLA
jgi:threonine dehydratase